MAKCPYCGNENPDASQFCAWCGRKKPDDLYLNADQFSEPWTYVPPSPAGQAQPGAFDPAQPTATPGTPKPAAADPWAATQAAAPAATSATSASDPWKAAMPTAQAEPMKTSASQEPPKAKKRLLIILQLVGWVLVIVIAALFVSWLPSRQAPREAENNATTAAQTTAVQTTAVQTTAAADGTIQINKPGSELRGAQRWSDDTADYAYYVKSGNGNNVYVVITNKTDRTIGIGLTARAKDASGAFVDDDCFRLVVLGAGQSTMTWLYWSEPIAADSIVFEPEYLEASDYYQSAIQDLDASTSRFEEDGRTGVEVKITNQGAETADDVEAYALFFDADGNFVDGDDCMIYTTDNYLLAPGTTGSGKLYSGEPFETFLIYVSGRSK